MGHHKGGGMRSAACTQKKCLLLAILILTLVVAVQPRTAQAGVWAWHYPTLQAAINACELYSGGTVVADAVTYNESIVIDSPNLVLQGQGKSTMITGVGGSPAITVTGSKVKVADLQVYSQGADNDAIYCTGAECEFEKIYVSGAGRYGLNIGGAGEYGSIVSDCVVENTYASALVAGQSRMRVSGCSFGQPTGTDVANATVLSTGDHNSFTNNFIEPGSAYSEGPARSIILDSGIASVVTGNVLLNGYCGATPESGNVVGLNSGTFLPVTQQLTYQVEANIYDDTFAWPFDNTNRYHFDDNGDVFLGDLYSPHHGFWKWPLTIPVGSTITSAVVQLRCSTADATGIAPVRLKALQADNKWESAGGFNTTNYANATALTNIPTQGPTISWDVPASLTAGTWYSSPDISAIVQTRIDDLNYDPLHPDRRFFGLRAYHDLGDTNKYKVFYGVKTGPDNSSAAELVITYTAPGAAGCE
jgi:hypothetical protein